MKIYIDTGPALAYIITNDPNHEIAENLISKRKESEFYLSELSIAEIASVLSRNIDLIQVENIYLNGLSAKDKVLVLLLYTIKKLNAKILKFRDILGDYIFFANDKILSKLFRKTIELAAKIKLRTLDLLHLIIASECKIDAFLTLDKEIIKRARLIESTINLEIIPKSFNK